MIADNVMAHIEPFWSVAESTGYESARSSMYVVDLAEWMCVL